MFIETLEFTIPIDLCGLFTTLQKGPRSNLEFPASVNSYGTTQDACLQVAVRSNKLTFKVEGVSSDSSVISKSECKTLKLAVFDVDRTLIPQESENNAYETASTPSKRSHDNSFSTPVPAKSSRTSYSESPQSRSPNRNIPHTQIKPRPPNHTQPKPQSDNVNVKQEPEDPDLIEIEPDAEHDDIVPKRETPYMQIDYSSNAPHTQTSQAALDRVSYPQSRSQSSSSFHQNVPHVPDYAEAGPSHQGDQSTDDFLVFQEDNDYGGDDNEADYSNDGNHGTQRLQAARSQPYFPSVISNPMGDLLSAKMFAQASLGQTFVSSQPAKQSYACQQCNKVFARKLGLQYHVKAIHENMTLECVCGKTYSYETNMTRHQKSCSVYLLSLSQGQ